MSPAGVGADDVHDVLGRHLLIDGYEFVLDLAASRGSHLVDARDGTSYLDMFGFSGSSPLGMNHPELAGDRPFLDQLTRTALAKPSNGDVYTVELAHFVETFRRVVGDPALPHLFLIDGGALAVENALKAAFDWKQQRNGQRGDDPSLGTQVLHLERAFHGRSGYTLSLTNTDPVKTDRFPTFSWPRIPAPVGTPEGQPEDEAAALERARAAFDERGDDIACCIVEPIQCEGGDRHLSTTFLRSLQSLCHERGALFVVDEVQTGGGATGTPWCYQQLGLEPDVVVFGKKLQVCGVMAGRRVGEVSENVFTVPGRLGSTWSGSLTDMVRSRRVLEVIEQDGLIGRARGLGHRLLEHLAELAASSALVTAPRGRGLIAAFDLPDPPIRDELLHRLRTVEHVLLLPCGARSVRFRPHLAVTEEDLAAACQAIGRVVAEFG